MNEHQDNKLEFEDQLANFTDLILNEKTDKKDENPFASDPELCALEETVLRLKNALSEEGPSEAVIHRMQKNINREWRQQPFAAGKPFWKKWFAIFQPSRQKWQSQRSQQRLSMVTSLVILAALLLVSIPILNGTNFDQPAASGQNLNLGVLAILGGLILLAILFFRRKQ
jgi:hypothetical protein